MITGRVYLIKGSEHWKVYIGSTTKSLTTRLRWHKNKNSKCMANQLINDKEVCIYLLEYGDFEDKNALRCCERKWYERYNTINKVRPFQTTEERKQKMNKYRNQNKEKLQELNKKWRQDNKEKIKYQRSKFYKNNTEKTKVKIKHYYKQNREKILEQKKKLNKYQSTWGGEKKYYNNLLKIDLDIFK